MFRSKLNRVAAVLAVASVPALSQMAHAAGTDVAAPTFQDALNSSFTVTNTYLLPGMAAIAGIGAVVWLFHRITGKFTKRRA